MNVKKILLCAVVVFAVSGCGGDKEKALELVRSTGLDKQYSTIVEIATVGYAPRYPWLSRDQIRQTVRSNLDQDDMTKKFVNIYAKNFDSDELDLIIQANKHPDQAMAIILGSKQGRALAEKSVQIQASMNQEVQESMREQDERIIKSLDKMGKSNKG